MRLRIFYIYLFIICQTINAQILPPQNMFPLTLGNKYQYFGYTSYPGYGYNFSLNSNQVIKDTLINGIKYFAFNTSGDFYRYDADSNKAFLWFDNVEGLYCDFNLVSGSTFTQFTPGSHGYRTAEIKVDSATIWGKKRTTVKLTAYDFYGSGSETFAQDIGIIGSSGSGSMGPDYDCSGDLINALLFDSAGNYIFYSDRYKPVMTFSPFYKIDNIFYKSFSVTVDHNFNALNYWAGKYSDGVIYIDSVYVDYFYRKNSTVTPVTRVKGLRNELTENYYFRIYLDTSLIKYGYNFNYRIAAKDKALIPEYSFSPDTGYYEAVYEPTSISGEFLHNISFSLEQNYPNPFNPNTVILYTLPAASNVKLIVFNTLGQEVKTLVSEYKNEGIHTINFNASDLPSGIYLYKLEAGPFSQIKKMMFLK